MTKNEKKKKNIWNGTQLESSFSHMDGQQHVLLDAFEQHSKIKLHNTVFFERAVRLRLHAYLK